jgi:NADP-dependent 3-hydroxy acid dehydrogenase YdfG
MVPLQGKVACVTGASGGIGEAIALALAGAGAKVAICARREEQLSRVKASIEAAVAGASVLTHTTDVTDRAGVKGFVAAAEAALGPVDIMVNNAGCMYFTHMAHLHEDEWDRMVDVNCKGVLNGVGAVLHGMKDRGECGVCANHVHFCRKASVGCASVGASRVRAAALHAELLGLT